MYEKAIAADRQIYASVNSTIIDSDNVGPIRHQAIISWASIH